MTGNTLKLWRDGRKKRKLQRTRRVEAAGGQHRTLLLKRMGNRRVRYLGVLILGRTTGKGSGHGMLWRWCLFVAGDYVWTGCATHHWKKQLETLMDALRYSRKGWSYEEGAGASLWHEQPYGVRNTIECGGKQREVWWRLCIMLASRWHGRARHIMAGNLSRGIQPIGWLWPRYSISAEPDNKRDPSLKTGVELFSILSLYFIV